MSGSAQPDTSPDAAASSRELEKLMMPVGICVLFLCQLLGETLRQLFHLPVPGPVLGMFLLAGALVLKKDCKSPSVSAAGSSLDGTADLLVRHMGLLFVPAGVGVVAEADLIRDAWLPLLVGLLGSTVLSLIATGLVMHWVTTAMERRRQVSESARSTVRTAR